MPRDFLIKMSTGSYPIIFSRGVQMSRKNTLFASSLTVCTATASWAVFASAEEPTIYPEMIDPKPNQWQQDAKGAIYKYLNPVAVKWQGEASVESHSLTYRVQKGDTLYKIAQLYKVNYKEIAKANRISNPDKIPVGKELKINVKKQLISVPAAGWTMEVFAEKTATDTEVLCQLNPNMKHDTLLEEGQLLYALVDQSNVRNINSMSKSVVGFKLQKADKTAFAKKIRFRKEPVRLAPDRGFSFLWPVRGTITSNFGWRKGRQHQGLDIWNSAKSKAPIKASRSGVVIKAGYFRNGYGNLVVIDHGGGWVTYYAHLSKINVTVNSKVSAGQIIGFMGTTGNSTGYHLHFEIRKNGKPYNPLKYLR